MFLRGWIGQFSGALNYFSPSGVHDFLVSNSLRKNFFHRKNQNNDDRKKAVKHFSNFFPFLTAHLARFFSADFVV